MSGLFGNAYGKLWQLPSMFQVCSTNISTCSEYVPPTSPLTPSMFHQHLHQLNVCSTNISTNSKYVPPPSPPTPSMFHHLHQLQVCSTNISTCSKYVPPTSPPAPSIFHQHLHQLQVCSNISTNSKYVPPTSPPAPSIFHQHLFFRYKLHMNMMTVNITKSWKVVNSNKYKELESSECLQQITVRLRYGAVETHEHLYIIVRVGNVYSYKELEVWRAVNFTFDVWWLPIHKCSNE